MTNPFAQKPFQKLYSLRKSRYILKTSYSLFKKQKNHLEASVRKQCESLLIALDDALLAEDRAQADHYARELESMTEHRLPKSFFTQVQEIVIAIVIAFCIAVFVRQIWFEPYEIPSGSMRPTFMEKDHLTVSKTAFGINFPFRTDHIYFDPDLVQRTSILIFSSDGIEHVDGISRYFWLFPAKKRVIKRLMGKPGDTLYFYGGRIYGIDKEGNDLPELRKASWMKNLEYIPFIHMDGKRVVRPPKKGDIATQVLFYQMNQPIGRLLIGPQGGLVGQIYNGKRWVADNPTAQDHSHDQLETYTDFWGIRNFGGSRLLTREEVERYTDLPLEGLDKGILYLEIRHNPSLSYPKPLLSEMGIQLDPYRSIIPLKEHHLKAIMENMYTARFAVNDGRASRYTMLDTGCRNLPKEELPLFPGVLDGVYEFYHGKAVRVGWMGMTTPLPADHPLYSMNPKHIQKLYNMGIEFCTNVMPRSQQREYPNRYVYFREGDLYLMGGPSILKADPILVNFHVREAHRQESASADKPYIPFQDYGPPVDKEGAIDVDFIRTFGITIPEKHYLVLGDNHAMSGDSRLFGFLPEKNIQGAPVLIIWPPEDIGPPRQKAYPWLNLPRSIIWGVAILIGVGFYIHHRRKLHRPLIPRK